MTIESEANQSAVPARLRLVIRGAVQGVGFRPFVFRLGNELGLNGWVNNSAQGVFIEAEGARDRLEAFLLRVGLEKPPRSSIHSLESSWLDPQGYEGFEIRESAGSGAKTTLILPDIATCPDCLRELFDPADRRYFYPFTNCTNCGPRFSIIEALPYDRANTSMKAFRMCPLCQAEYDDPQNRRFHAQPNACPVCGPHLEFWDADGKSLISPAQPSGWEPKLLSPAAAAGHSGTALMAAADAIQAGKIVAVKGLGGFHLVVSSRDASAVNRLRERKHREEKPLAVMFPSLEAIQSCCQVSATEERLLLSPEAPIVLLRRRTLSADSPLPVADSVAPGNPNLGVMLPYTPLHHLLLAELRVPVVATSGNLSDEPICTDEHEAVERLRGIAEGYLVHNRPIRRHVDDSVVRVMAGRELVLRRARGYAPLPISPGNLAPESPSVLAVGAHLKNAVALSQGARVFVSQHIGDLETNEAYGAFRRVISDLQNLYEVTPATIAADAHPDYLSSKFAREETARLAGPELRSVQHHLAHVLSCMGENDLRPPVLGVAWDGTGYGLDATVWGGEFFIVNDTDWRRFAHLRVFPLPGGDQAIREPRRTVLGLVYAALGEAAFKLVHLPALKAFSAAELSSLQTMLRRRLNSPLTSSVGRLFDAVSSLMGLRQRVRFEGQAAMELEFALEHIATQEAYTLDLTPAEASPTSALAPQFTRAGPQPALGRGAQVAFVIDWASLLEQLLADAAQGTPPGVISARFHNALVEGIIAVARRAGLERIVMSGGCFQNRYLTERAVHRLGQEGFRAYWHQRVPPNDGGIALGQALAALAFRFDGQGAKR